LRKLFNFSDFCGALPDWIIVNSSAIAILLIRMRISNLLILSTFLPSSLNIRAQVRDFGLQDGVDEQRYKVVSTD
jgi:hypothetical protein